MSYQNSLSPWVIYRRLPNFQRQFIDRFRRRTHAEEYLKVIQRLSPHAEFEIVYEITQAESPHPKPLSRRSYCVHTSLLSLRSSPFSPLNPPFWGTLNQSFEL